MANQVDETLFAMRAKAEAKANYELQQLRANMEKSRCNECGFTCYEHQDWCPKRKL